MSEPHFCPAYPRPRRKRASLLALFTGTRSSWLDILYERSYSMQMGEVHLPAGSLYMVNDPEVVRQMLVREPGLFPKSRLLADVLRPLLGNSVLTTGGEQWARQREMMAPAFEQTKLDIAFPAMQAAAEAMVARLRARMHGRPAGVVQDMEAEMAHVTADIIFRTIFSEPLAGEDAQRIFEAFGRFQSLAPKLVMPRLFGVPWLVWPWQVAQSRRAAVEIRGLLEKLIRARREASGTKADDGQKKNDILAAFMAARDAQTGEPFSFDELVDQVAVLFLAGHETTSSALAWALHLLANAPSVQARAHAEVVGVTGGGRPIQTDMKALVLVRNVFRETLRLFPPVGFMAREAAQTCPMRDKTVAEGASVVVSPWLIHRHRQRWAEPDVFDPDRFEDEGSRESRKDAYLPFGWGPRACLGAAFATQEATLILAAVLHAFRLEPVAGDVPRPVGRLTIRSGNGVRLRLYARGETVEDPA